MEWDINLNMKKRKKTSIQSKTLIFLLIFNVVIIGLLWYSEIAVLDIYYEKEQIEVMNHIANTIKNTSDVEMITKLQDIAYQNDVCMLLTNDSEILGGYNLNMNGCVLKSNSNKIKRLMNSFIDSNENFKAYRFIFPNYKHY